MKAKVNCEVRFTKELVQITTDRNRTFEFKCNNYGDISVRGTVSCVISSIIGGTVNALLTHCFGENMTFSFEFQTNTGAETR